ncbi:MAG: PAS domain S-box protein [Methanobacterium sp.]
MARANDWLEKVRKGLETAKKKGEISENVIELLSELMVYQAELEMENERLKKADEVLRESEERFKLTFDKSPIGTAMVSTDFKTLKVNEVLCQISGYSEEELLGMKFPEYTHPEDVDADVKQCEQIISGEINQFDMDKRYIRKDGEIIWAHLCVRAVRDSAGKILYFISMIEDITKRKNVETELKSIIHGSPVLIFVIDKNHKALYWNKAIEEYSGVTAKEVIGTQNYWKAFYKEKRPLLADLVLEKKFEEISRWYSYYDKSKTVKGAYEIEAFFPTMGILPVMGKKGRWLRATASTINDYEEKIVGAIEILEDITEHKKADEALKENENNLTAFLNAIQVAGFLIDTDGTVIIANEPLLKYLNKNMDEIIGYNIRDFIPSFIGESFDEYCQKVIKTKAPLHFEGEHQETYIEHYINPVFDLKGNVSRLAVIASDITKHKQDKEELRNARDNLEEQVEKRTKELKGAYSSLSESEEKFRELFNKANDVITLGEITKDRMPGKFIEVNEAAIQKLGYSKDELLNMTPLDIIQKEIDEAPENASKILEDGKSKFEAVHVAKDGSKIPVEVNTHLFNLKGKDVILGISHDISERKKAEEEIKNHSIRLDILNRIIIAANRSENVESLLSDVLDLTLELMNFEAGGIYLINEDRKVAKIVHYKGLPKDFIETVNNITIDEYPYSEIFINGKSMFMDRYDKIRPEYAHWNLKSGASVPIYSSNKIIGALNIANRRLHHFKDEEKQLIKSIGREIGNTITKLITENNLKKSINELERSNEELQQFAHVASHDLQEPLRTIASFTQLLERRYKGQLDENADEFMDYIVEASVRMKAQIEGLLEYSRVVTKGKEFELVDTNKALNQTIKILDISIKEADAEITYDELTDVMGDTLQLERVFQNLISNAIKFRKREEPLKIHISAYESEDGNEYVFSVQDNGIGIEEQYMERIFTIFQRLHTRDVYKGTGIGLAIVKRIIERHGGRIWVESEFGVGSVFYFTLPKPDET